MVRARPEPGAGNHFRGESTTDTGWRVLADPAGDGLERIGSILPRVVNAWPPEVQRGLKRAQRRIASRAKRAA